MAATRTKRTSSTSDLAKAQATRGQTAGNLIAGQVIDRIVQNSSKDFQEFLSRAGGGNASAGANVMMAQSPSVPFGANQQAVSVPPVPFGTVDQAVAVPPVPYGDVAGLMGGGLPSAPALMPTVAPAPAAMPSILPAPPSLSPTRQYGDPGAERLLRAFGLI